MVGRRGDETGEGGSDHDGEDGVAVDVTLESDLASAEEAIEAYLAGPSADRRNHLVAELERLDRHIDDSDAYESSVIGSGAVGFSSKGAVIGETSSASVAEEVPESVLRAQTALIKAAKREVAAPTAGTLADLRAAALDLSAARSR
jgi:hypothetical protein